MLILTKHFSIAIFISILLILTGCQTKAKGSDLNSQANEIYLSIKDNWDNKEAISENEQEEINKFTEKYIYNSDEYPSDEELIMEMDQLINNYRLYFVASGQNDEVAKEKHENAVNESLANLDKQFNK